MNETQLLMARGLDYDNTYGRYDHSQQIKELYAWTRLSASAAGCRTPRIPLRER